MTFSDADDLNIIILDCRRLLIEGFDDEKFLIKEYPELCSGQIHAIMAYANSPLNAKEFSKRVSSISIKTKKDEIKEIMEASI